MSTEYVCSHITSVSDLAQIETDWRELQERHPPLTPFASYEWMSAWYRHIASHPTDLAVARHVECRAIDVVVARHDARIVAIAPMIQTERGELQSAVGTDSGYWEMVFDPDHPMAVRELLAAMLSQTPPGGRVDLLRVPRDSATSKQLQAECHIAGIPIHITNGRRMALIDCANGFEAYAAEHHRLMKDMRYHHRRLQRLGTVAYTVETGRTDLEAQLERFMALEGSGWKASAGWAISCHPHRVRFYADLSKALAAAGRLAIHFLTLDGKAIAVRYTMQWGDAVYSLKIGYDPAHSKYSPGNVLAWFLVRSLFSSPERGCVDLLDIDAGDWKERWMTSVRHCDDFHIFPPTLRGAWRGFLSYGLRSQLKRSTMLVRIVRKLRSWRRRSAEPQAERGRRGVADA